MSRHDSHSQCKHYGSVKYNDPATLSSIVTFIYAQKRAMLAIASYKMQRQHAQHALKLVQCKLIKENDNLVVHEKWSFINDVKHKTVRAFKTEITIHSFS